MCGGAFPLVRLSRTRDRASPFPVQIIVYLLPFCLVVNRHSREAIHAGKASRLAPLSFCLSPLPLPLEKFFPTMSPFLLSKTWGAVLQISTHVPGCEEPAHISAEQSIK
jgi:hypothetical protein